MARSRMFDDEVPDLEAHPSPRTTIVGGRPPDDTKASADVPRGLQRLLRLASSDLSVRTALVARRGEIAAELGVELTPTEHAILAAVPRSSLESMIDKLPPPSVDRRSYVGRSTKGALILLGGAVIAEACAITSCGGAAPDRPFARPIPTATNSEPAADAAVDPDVVVPPAHSITATEGGAAPSVPPAK